MAILTQMQFFMHNNNSHNFVKKLLICSLKSGQTSQKTLMVIMYVSLIQLWIFSLKTTLIIIISLICAVVDIRDQRIRSRNWFKCISVKNFEATWAPKALPALKASQSSPSSILVAAVEKESKPKTGRYSWLIFSASMSCASFSSAFLTTGRILGAQRQNVTVLQRVTVKCT
jgi:hypothetical protein